MKKVTIDTMKTHIWPFPVPPEYAVYTTDHVIARMKPIIHIARSSDDTWQFLSEDGADEGSIKIVQFKTMLDRHPYIVQFADLQLGWEAWRVNTLAPWNRRKDPEEP